MTQTRETSPITTTEHAIITAELIAKTVTGIAQIGYAQRALQEAGWTATVVANRITVAGIVEARLVSTNGQGFWQVYAADGSSPVWTVGTQCETTSSWVGAE